MVRWRAVGESASPLRTDGLPLRVIDLRPDEPQRGPLQGAWLEPPNAGPAVLFYLHGGGYVFGSMRTHGTLIAALARAARARTFALEYRLAPEHPAPAALEDAVLAYRHPLAEGIAPERIVFVGDPASDRRDWAVHPGARRPLTERPRHTSRCAMNALTERVH